MTIQSAPVETSSIKVSTRLYDQLSPKQLSDFVAGYLVANCAGQCLEPLYDVEGMSNEDLNNAPVDGIMQPIAAALRNLGYRTNSVGDVMRGLRYDKSALHDVFCNCLTHGPIEASRFAARIREYERSGNPHEERDFGMELPNSDA